MSQRVKAESTPTTQSSAKTEKPKTSNKKVRNNEDEQQLKKLKQNLADKEAQIEQLEQQVEAIEGEMALPEVFENQEVLAEKTDKHQALKTSLQKVQQEWESLYLEIEAQEAD